MRPGSWLLVLSLMFSAPAAAQVRLDSPWIRRRLLVAPLRPEQVPPLELQVRSGVASLLLFEAPLSLGAVTLPLDEKRLQLVPMDDGSLIIVPTTDLRAGEQVPLTVEARPGAEPLRFMLVTRSDAVDIQVRVVKGEPSADEAAVAALARSLLSTPDGRAILAVPQRTVDLDSRASRGEAESVLWMERRFFATVAMRSRKKGTSPWRLVQARLRATLEDGVLLEWPAHLLSGDAGLKRQRHILTGVLPEGASRLELALDGEDSPGTFQPLPLEEARTRP
ncbi:DUF2381 family protein [Archangium lansingense]|uniref:DUF2381 family protein n=1 Tax=Archangium lansingense TaxID=2995310 RepID=A0ABT4A1V6_9BACT|nr:DUF2381 family protein [Archangium lansinium]MCY1075632.1 DUF2381 family protein [Archangium lansinium]